MKLNRLLLAAALAALSLTLVLTTAASPLAAQDTPLDPPQPLLGRDSYLENCAPCHGVSGLGDGPSAQGLGVPPTAFAELETIGDLSLQAMFDITKNGRMQQMMPPWKDRLSDQQIWESVAYAWTLHTSAEEIEQGRQVYDANCASCHGPDGSGAQASVPDLSDFAATSGVSQGAWAQVVAGGRGNMPGFAGSLSEADQAAALEYVRSLSMGGPLFRGRLAKGTGIITGTVTNGTAGQPVVGLAVELGIFDGTEMLEQRTTTTDAAGVYRFTDLPTDATLAYAVRVEYPAGVPTSSDFASFEADVQVLELPVQVYESTTDPAGVVVERAHYIVEFDQGTAYVAELVVFSLEGDRTFVGNASGVLRFPLPAGAQELAINDAELGGRFTATAEGFVDNLPLQPGRNVRQVLYRYALPYAGSELDFARALPYRAANINALVSDVGQRVSSAQLQDQGSRQTESGTYFNLLGRDLPANQQVLIRMSALPSATGSGAAAGNNSNLGRALVLILVGLMVAGAAVLIALPMMRRRAAANPAAAGSILSDRDALLEALARLERSHDSGELPDGAYRDQILRLKAALRDMMRKEAQG